MPPGSTPPDNSPPSKNRLGDLLFYSVVAVLALIALVMIGYIVWDGWQSANAAPTELVISRTELNLPETPEPELLTLPRGGTPTAPAATAAGAPAVTAAGTEPALTPVPVESATPAATSAPATPLSGQERRPTFLQDDFSTDLLNWSTVVRESSLRGYAGGAYFIEVSAPAVYALSFIPLELPPTSISFDAAAGNEARGGTYGVLCQYLDENNFYLIEVRAETGELAIGARQEAEYKPLTDPEWQPISGYNTSVGAINQFLITCTPEHIQVNINAIPAAQVNVPQPLRTGQKAALFAAGGAESGGAVFRMYFDNLTARADN